MKINADALPDIAESRNPQIGGRLDEVGMDDIAVPVVIAGERCASRVSAQVNLIDADARGIHMSRLYSLVSAIATRGSLTPKIVRELLSEMLKSHPKLADRARLTIDFELLLERRALASGQLGWRSYRASIDGQLSEQGAALKMSVEVLYSSTCPSSAALARQLVAAQFVEDFPEGADQQTVASWLNSERGMRATPHAQRSSAQVEVLLPDAASAFDFPALIDCVEAALKTPVQAAVKRADEQAFARLNGENLMFCEDAARRLQIALGALDMLDFSARVRHFESLHAHNAVAFVRKQQS